MSLPPSLPQLGASATEVTVSGMSSGGFMTVQMHTIYSDFFKGAGIVAGGPYHCADFGVQWTNCTIYPENLNVTDLIQKVKNNAASTEFPISDPVNLANQPVWMQSGVLDTIVYPPVMDKLYQIY